MVRTILNARLSLEIHSMSDGSAGGASQHPPEGSAGGAPASTSAMFLASRYDVHCAGWEWTAKKSMHDKQDRSGLQSTPSGRCRFRFSRNNFN
jgi:hypothetical protein